MLVKGKDQSDLDQTQVVRWAKKLAVRVWDEARTAFAKAVNKEFALKRKTSDIHHTVMLVALFLTRCRHYSFAS